MGERSQAGSLFLVSSPKATGCAICADVVSGCSEARTLGIRGSCEAFGRMIGFKAPEQVAANFVEGIQGARKGGRGVCGVG